MRANYEIAVDYSQCFRLPNATHWNETIKHELDGYDTAQYAAASHYHCCRYGCFCFWASMRSYTYIYICPKRYDHRERWTVNGGSGERTLIHTKHLNCILLYRKCVYVYNGFWHDVLYEINKCGRKSYGNICGGGGGATTNSRMNGWVCVCVCTI